jgi:apoptosis-inducing factor 3
MASQPEELSGPDLAAGIPLDSIADGALIGGHAYGEPVLLARRGNELFAVGAKCTHYGGPLPDGLMVGDTVRCPWHHACFSLRTGEALRAPALNPIACYPIVRDGPTVRVGPKTEREPLAGADTRLAIDPTVGTVVIVGGGAAGSAGAEMTRRVGFGGRVIVIDDDPSAPYDRPNTSKDYLAGTAPEEWIPLRPDGFYPEHGIEIIRAHATRIDTATRQVHASDGSRYAYDRLLLAAGADPVHLDTPGANLPHVHYLRTLADSRAIIAKAGSSKRAVVIGASFIGLETAASLRNRGLEVDVVAPESRPLERVMGPELGDFIKALHEEHGVRFHLGQTATSIAATQVTLSGGGTLPCDLVVIGVGVRPRLTLAQEAGLTMDRGIAVNEFLETSVPGVFAAGDVARFPDSRSGHAIRVEHWVVAQRMGQAAARNMVASRREPFDDVPFFWSQHYDVPINYVGHAERWDRIDVEGDIAGRDCALRFIDGDRVAAVATIYRDRDSLEAEAEMEGAAG